MRVSPENAERNSVAISASDTGSQPMNTASATAALATCASAIPTNTIRRSTTNTPSHAQMAPASTPARIPRRMNSS